ncbi:hypothetical protein GCM10020295_79740 [Streptomyces cinereospinus]
MTRTPALTEGWARRWRNGSGTTERAGHALEICAGPGVRVDGAAQVHHVRPRVAGVRRCGAWHVSPCTARAASPSCRAIVVVLLDSHVCSGGLIRDVSIAEADVPHFSRIRA